MIGNRIYANRYGNGSEASGDGFKYRGRGLIQITFKDNYEAIGDSLDIDLVSYPAQLLRSELAALSAALYWHAHGCNELADAGDIRGITRAINGGYNGLKQRLMYTAKANALLGVK
jgi:putative chitinase